MKKNIIFISRHTDNEVGVYDIALSENSFLTIKAVVLVFATVEQFSDFIKSQGPDYEFSLLVHMGRGQEETNIQGDVFEHALSKLPYYGILKFEFTSRLGDGLHENKKVRSLPKLAGKAYNLDEIPVNKVGDLLDIKAGDDKQNQPAKEDGKVSNPPEEVPASSPNPEIAILTALFRDEHDAFDKNMSLDRVKAEKNLKLGKFSPGSKLASDYQEDILVSWQQDLGNVNSAAFTSRLITKYSPKFLIMGGVCGGLKSDVKLYDIIIPKNIHDYMSGKFKGGKFVPRPLQAEPSRSLVGFLEEREEQILENMRKIAQPNIMNILNDGFKIHFKNYACGSLVMKTGGVLEDIAKSYDDDIIGLEMESLGVIAASNLFKKHNEYAIVVKSVMDFTDENKQDGINGSIKTNAALMSYVCVRAIVALLKDFVDPALS